jgi:hypothetical protein
MRAANDTCDYRDIIAPSNKNLYDIVLQLVLSLILGLSALVTFCVRGQILLM